MNFQVSWKSIIYKLLQLLKHGSIGRFRRRVIFIEGFFVYRRDREFGRGGGVCVYVSKATHRKRLADLEDADHECMWIWLRPNRLPRPLPCVLFTILLIVTCKNSAIDSLRNKYPDCSIAVLGDFNNLNISDLTSRQNLKQVVSRPTRNNAILDLIITDFHRFYEDPIILAPFGTSDHNIIV